LPQLAAVALLLQRRSLYCSRLGEFTGFERGRRSWVIQEVLRWHASSRATFPNFRRFPLGGARTGRSGRCGSGWASASHHDWVL